MVMGMVVAAVEMVTPMSTVEMVEMVAMVAEVAEVAMVNVSGALVPLPLQNYVTW